LSPSWPLLMELCLVQACFDRTVGRVALFGVALFGVTQCAWSAMPSLGLELHAALAEAF